MMLTDKQKTELIAWVKLPEGKRAILEALEITQKDIDALRKSREIPPGELDKPMTI